MSEVRVQRLRLLWVAGVLAPAAMGIVGLLLAWLATGTIPALYHPPQWRAVLLGAGTAGLSMGLITLLYKSSKTFEEALRQSGTRVGEEALETAGYPVMLVVVGMAGLGEEILFRGGLQPLIGLVPAALLFGFSHGGWRREMWAYAVAASLSGLLFGLVYQATGDLWVTVIAHALHNILSTFLLGKKVEVSWEGFWPVIRLVSEVDDEDGDDVAAGGEDEVGTDVRAGAVDVTRNDSADDAEAEGEGEHRVGINETEETEASRMIPWRSPYAPRPTARTMGLTSGLLPTGPQNDICDVPGVRVGHATVVRGEGDLIPGEGPVRTGVTAILPHGGNLFAEKVPVGLFVLNGFGKSIGLAQAAELGTLESPILLTNTLSAFRAADALVSYMIEQNPSIGITTGTINPLVGECNDGYLNDIQGRHVTAEHVRTALESASSGPVEQGAAGAGTGMVCFGFKGGIGSASRTVEGYTLGALVLANFGKRGDLMIHGVPVGQRLLDYTGQAAPASPAATEPVVPPEPENVPPGSVMVILATDAPLDARRLTRLSKRGAMGLARLGASAANGSGDFILSFSTQNRVSHEPAGWVESTALLRDDSPAMDRLFLAAVEAVEEAVINALWCAVRVEGRDHRVIAGLPVDQILALLKEQGQP